jgi:hypothetical protein
MYYFITLFDKNYLSRGLALYKSLLKNCDNFILYVLAIDLETDRYLSGLNESTLKVISLSSVETKYLELFSVKGKRTRGEYCWTLTPYCIQYAITTFNLDFCIYLDSDIYFFNDPKCIIENLGNDSVIITEHRYSPEYDQTYTSGKYCVQFMYFKNNSSGLNVLEWWRHCCFEWCYARNEDGKFGDQKYLDDWTTRFKNIYVPTHIGCGLAPWNINRYDLSLVNDRLYIQDRITKEKNIVIFYHFHGLIKTRISSYRLLWHLGNGYDIDETIKEFIYREYIDEIINIEGKLDKTLIMSISDKKTISKPSFFSVAWLVFKNILSSFLIFRRYRYFKKIKFKQYIRFQGNLLETLIPKNSKIL